MKLTPPIAGAPGKPALVGMVHALALPGSPAWPLGGGAPRMQKILDQARRDAEALLDGGCDALIVENMHDLPYLRGRVAPETVAAMTLVTAAVVAFGRPTGVQVLAAANREALGVAVAAGATFIRVEAFAYAHVADEGWLDASAGELLRARAALGADVAVWADIKKKHSAHAVTARRRSSAGSAGTRPSARAVATACTRASAGNSRASAATSRGISAAARSAGSAASALASASTIVSMAG